LSLIASSSANSPTATFRRGIKSEILETGSTIIRIHHKDNGAIWFGPKPGLPRAYRFDAPAAEYRTMYAAVAIEGAFVETILHGKTEEQIVSRAYVEQRAWTEFTTVRPFNLMKLYNEGLFWHGTDASITAMPSYTRSRQMALAAFREGPDLDGIAYRSRHDNGELCFALFDRVTSADFDPGRTRLFHEHPRICASLMAKYGAVYDTSPPVPPPP
jgi:RES domain